MNHEAVLFDAAETLFTTKGSVGEIYAAVARRFGSLASADEIQDAFSREFRHSGPLSTEHERAWWRDVVQRVFINVGMVNNFDQFFAEVYEQFRGGAAWRLFPETRSVLNRLKRAGLRTGIVSNFDSRLYAVLTELGIRDLVDAVTISSETGFAKPSPGIFRAAIESSAVPPERILFAGDSLVDDYQAALGVGLDAYLLDRHARYSEMKSVRRIRSLEELPVLAGVS